MKKMFYLILVSFVHQMAYGMSYRGGGVTPLDTVFLIPVPTSEDLKSSNEKIPLLRQIAEKSKYIAPFLLDENRLLNGKEIIVHTDYPEGLKALAKLYTQEDQNKPVTLGVKELSSLVRSNLIDYLDMPKPKENIQKKLDDMTTIFLVPFPESEALADWKTKNSFYEKIPLPRKIAEKSDYIKTAHLRSFKSKDNPMGLSGHLYDSSNEESRLVDGEEIFVQTDFPEDLKALAKLYEQEESGKPVVLSVNELIHLIGSKPMDFLLLPKLNKDPQDILAKAIKENPADSIGSFFEWHDGEVLSVSLIKRLIRDLVRTKGIDRSLLFQYSQGLRYKGKRVVNKHVAQFEKEGIKREDLLYVDDDRRIYGTVKTTVSSAYYDKLVFVDNNDKRSEVTLPWHYCTIGKIKIIPGLNKLFYSVRRDFKDSYYSIIDIDANRLNAVFDESNVKIFPREKYKYSDSSEKTLQVMYSSDNGSYYNVSGKKLSFGKNQSDYSKVYSFLVGNGKLIVSCGRHERFFDRDDVRYISVDSGQNWFADLINKDDNWFCTSDGRNIVINPGQPVAKIIPLYDNVMIEALDYLDVTKKSDMYSYNQKLDGILLLASILPIDKQLQFNEVEQKVFDTCLPDSIKELVIGLGRSNNGGMPSTLLSSLRNYTQTMYNAFTEKLYTYRKGLLFGASAAIGSAAFVAAMYKYVNSLPSKVYHLD